MFKSVHGPSQGWGDPHSPSLQSPRGPGVKPLLHGFNFIFLHPGPNSPSLVCSRLEIQGLRQTEHQPWVCSVTHSLSNLEQAACPLRASVSPTAPAVPPAWDSPPTSRSDHLLSQHAPCSGRDLLPSSAQIVLMVMSLWEVTEDITPCDEGNVITTSAFQVTTRLQEVTRLTPSHQACGRL